MGRACRPCLWARTFSQVLNVHDLALRDPAHVASEVLLQLLLLPELLEGSPGLGLLPLLSEFAAVEQGRRGREEKKERVWGRTALPQDRESTFCRGVRPCLLGQVPFQVTEGQLLSHPFAVPTMWPAFLMALCSSHLIFHPTSSWGYLGY